MDQRFIIFYGDGSIYTGPPEGAPAVDVQVIATEDEREGGGCGRFLHHAWDFYIYSDRVQGWHFTNHVHDVFDHLAMGCGPGGVRAVLRGRWMDRQDFYKILKRAETEGELPDRGGAPFPRRAMENGLT